MSNLKIIYVQISDIVPFENNPRKNDKAVEIVMKSIKEFGFLVPVILDNKNYIVCGHTRIKAAIKLGMSEVPAIYAENLTDAQLKAFRIMDNKSTEYSNWDYDLLKLELQGLKDMDFDLKLTGLSEIELNKLTDFELEEKPIDTTKPKYTILPGETYQLGNHRLMCGDSTRKEDVDKLMNGKRATICLTDPPYSVDYKSRKEVTNETLDSYQDPKSAINLLTSFIALLPSDILIMTYAERHIPELMEAYKVNGFEHNRMLIWKKQHFTFHMGSNYNNIYEPIFIGRRKNAKLICNTDSTATDVLEYDRKMKNDIHPTEKPLELYNQLLVNHTNSGDSVYEPFGGSGTTLLSCEIKNRICYCIEISPQYVSTIIERFENLTGKIAIKLSP